jgi:hypothetical protein
LVRFPSLSGRSVSNSPGKRGFEERTFECSTCRRIENVSFPIDPMKTDALGWLAI